MNKYYIFLVIIAIMKICHFEPTKNPENPSEDDETDPMDAEDLRRMFVATHLVPKVIPYIPKHTYYVKIRSRNTSLAQLKERPGKESLINDYQEFYPNDKEKIKYFFMHLFVHDYKQMIAKLHFNKYWIEIITYWTECDPSRFDICKEIQKSSSHIDKYINNPVRYSDSLVYPISCKFLGDKKFYTLDVFLFGEHERWAQPYKYEKYQNNRGNFVLKDFLHDVGGNITHGASIRNICDNRIVKKLQYYLLPGIILMSICCIFGALVTLYYERRRYKASLR